MKKNIILLVLAITVLIGTVIYKTNYDNTHFWGYNFRSSTTYSGRTTHSKNWDMVGEEKLYNLDELRELGKAHRVCLVGELNNVPPGIAIMLDDDNILVVPGVTPSHNVADSYGIF